MITIKAPVPWKCSIQVAKNRLEQILMVNHPVIRAINMLWHNLYNNLIIVDSASFYTGDVPYHAETITEMIHKSCKITRDVSDTTILSVSCSSFFVHILIYYVNDPPLHCVNFSSENT